VTEIDIQTASDRGLTRAFKHNGATASIACLRPTRRLIAASDQQPNRTIIDNHAISRDGSRYSKPSGTTAITNSSRAYHAKTPHPYSNLKSPRYPRSPIVLSRLLYLISVTVFG
jgi:hypothetical protein